MAVRVQGVLKKEQLFVVTVRTDLYAALLAKIPASVRIRRTCIKTGEMATMNMEKR